jgi:hypothetical protein
MISFQNKFGNELRQVSVGGRLISKNKTLRKKKGKEPDSRDEINVKLSASLLDLLLVVKLMSRLMLILVLVLLSAFVLILAMLLYHNSTILPLLSTTNPRLEILKRIGRDVRAAD